MLRNVLIAGLAKTGTTILFSRVRATLGSPIRTFFEPSTSAELAGILKGGSATPTLTKCLVGHIADSVGEVSQFSHVVLIVRDPRDQFVSELLYDFYKFTDSGNIDGYEAALNLVADKVANPSGRSCTSLFREVREIALGCKIKNSPVKTLRAQYAKLEAFRERFDPFVVLYEDIIKDQLGGLANFLDVDAIVQAEVDNSVTRVRRSMGYGDWKQWFTPEDVAEFEAELGDTLTRFGYSRDPLPSPQHIPAATSLNYIAQFRPS